MSTLKQLTQEVTSEVVTESTVLDRLTPWLLAGYRVILDLVTKKIRRRRDDGVEVEDYVHTIVLALPAHVH